MDTSDKVIFLLRRTSKTRAARATPTFQPMIASRMTSQRLSDSLRLRPSPSRHFKPAEVVCWLSVVERKAVSPSKLRYRVNSVHELVSTFVQQDVRKQSNKKRNCPWCAAEGKPLAVSPSLWGLVLLFVNFVMAVDEADDSLCKWDSKCVRPFAVGHFLQQRSCFQIRK